MHIIGTNDMKHLSRTPYLSKSKNAEDDEDDIRSSIVAVQRKPYQAYIHTFTAQHIHFYISEPVDEPWMYAEMIHTINVATENDIVFMHLNFHGGDLDTGVQIITAMQNSAAKIITVLEGAAYSLGTLIFLAGDEMIVNDNCMMMFHYFKGGIGGKGNEIVSQLEATVKWFASLAKELYIPFMSEDEFQRMTRGEDLWMQSPEIRQRLDNMHKILNDDAVAKQTKQKKSKS